VAVADLNGDGVPDVVTAPGKGGVALVRVFDGRDGSLMVEFNAFEPQWTGGVTVAATVLLPDGRAIVAVGADAGGGPHVKVFDLAQGKEIDSFFAYPEPFRGGVRVAAHDFDRDGVLEAVSGAGPGLPGSPLRVFSGKNPRPLADAPAFADFNGGCYVAAL